ncbi:hypothetical protein, partial [Leyella stercorea]|uniref:hypothetical protein n=1 Tax=Leyella stercorea TaxID=363265 RepID=UPI001F16A7E9
ALPPAPPPQGGELYDLNADMVGDGITVRASKVKAARPKGAEAHSPGHTPWVKVSQITMRPAGAKALIINAFAPAGRIAIFNSYTQGAALGYELIGLSARIV